MAILQHYGQIRFPLMCGIFSGAGDFSAFIRTRKPSKNETFQAATQTTYGSFINVFVDLLVLYALF